MATTKTVTASIVVDFTQDASEGILTVEIDSRETGYNGGDTNFTQGSAPYLLLFKSSNVVIDKIACSEGAMVLVNGSEVITDSEYLTYASEKSASPQHPISTGSASVQDSAGLTSSPTIGETAVTFTTAQIAVLKLAYSTVAMVYRLAGAAGTRPVVVYIAGHTI